MQTTTLRPSYTDCICVDPRTDPLWHKLVSQCPSDVFHSPAWLHVLSDTYGWTPHARLLLDDADEPRCGIPFYRIADVRGERIVILPFSDYCDPLIDDAEHWSCLIDDLTSERRPITTRCLHNDLPLADTRFDVVNRARWHGIDLHGDLQTLWNRLEGSSRRAINKAQRDGVLVRVARDKEELRLFFDLHLKTRKYKYRLLAQPYSFLENIWRHFVETHQGVLLVAIYQGDIIGGTMYLQWQDKLYYKFNASSSAGLPHRPNDLLLWEGIRYAKAKGCTLLDLGLSDWDEEGLVRYKRKVATTEKTISYLQYTPECATGHQEQHVRALLPHLTDLFTDPTVPDDVTERAGDSLYRFFA